MKFSLEQISNKNDLILKLICIRGNWACINVRILSNIKEQSKRQGVSPAEDEGEII